MRVQEVSHKSGRLFFHQRPGTKTDVKRSGKRLASELALTHPDVEIVPFFPHSDCSARLAGSPMFDDRSAYPHPEEFKVMRPEYDDPEEEGHDYIATITIPPFRVTGLSASRPGARRAALYEAEKTYRNYHPSHRMESPFPDEFEDADGVTWTRVKASQRDELGDYEFKDEDGEDYADIEQMLSWDIRPEPVYDDEDEE